MTPNFDELIDRRHSNSIKWNKFDPSVLPFWVADMDFAAPDFILHALRERLEHPIVGYSDTPDSLTHAFQGWLQYHFDWIVPEEWIVWIPGVVPALNLAAQSIGKNDGLLIPTPVYHPFFDLANNAGITDIRVPLSNHDDAWRMDFDALSAAKDQHTRMMMICNPQNPTGRCYSEDELSGLAKFVDQHNLLLVSDEIHCNIILDGKCTHRPIAAAHPDIAHRTISLFAATKVYNIPGISCAAAVIPDAQLRRSFLAARRGLQPNIGPLGIVASEAAFNDRSGWIPSLMQYLRGNLSLLHEALGERLSPHEATYLAWIYVGDLNIENTQLYFADHGIGISPGAQFGRPDYIRLNFGCPRNTLIEGLLRLKLALDAAK